MVASNTTSLDCENDLDKLKLLLEKFPNNIKSNTSVIEDPVWTTSTGEHLPLSQMNDIHLINLAKWWMGESKNSKPAESRKDDIIYWLSCIRTEIMRRRTIMRQSGLKLKYPSSMPIKAIAHNGNFIRLGMAFEDITANLSSRLKLKSSIKVKCANNSNSHAVKRAKFNSNVQ